MTMRAFPTPFLSRMMMAILPISAPMFPRGWDCSVAEIDAMKTITALVGRPLFAVTDPQKNQD
ncbi:MAG: hypothetical protein R2861_13545 [Desulfobacterales bacterium]